MAKNKDEQNKETKESWIDRQRNRLDNTKKKLKNAPEETKKNVEKRYGRNQPDADEILAETNTQVEENIPLALAIIFSILLFFFAVRTVNIHRNNESIRDKIAEINDVNKEIELENTRQKELQELAIDTLDFGVLDDMAEEVIEKVFSWKDWEEYYNNSNYLGENFALLAEDERIDTDGSLVGTAQPAPKSTIHSTRRLVSTNYDELGYIVQQQISGQTSYTRRVWYFKFGVDENDELYLLEYTPIRLLTNLSDVPEVTDSSRNANDDVFELEDIDKIKEGNQEDE